MSLVFTFQPCSLPLLFALLYLLFSPLLSPPNPPFLDYSP